METNNNLELDDNEDTKYQNLYDVVKVILKWKFILVMKKDEKLISQIFNLNLKSNKINHKKVEKGKKVADDFGLTSPPTYLESLFCNIIFKGCRGFH